MRPTTKRRLAIVAGSTLTVSVALFGAYEFRQHQINAQTLAYRAEGMDAFHHGDYAKALIPLSKYNERRPTDPEALFAFGKARSRVEAPNNRHLAEAIQYYRRGLELDPSNVEAKHALLDLYSQTGFHAEAIALSDELLRRDPKDADALRAKAKALAARSQFKDAFAASSRLNDLKPDDMEGQALTFVLMSPRCLNLPTDQILARADKLQKAHPDDPRFVLLQGYAHHCALDDDAARKLYVQAAAKPPTDPDFVKVCTQMMDEVGLFDESQKLLETASANGHDPRMLRMLIQRLWQNGRYAQVVDRLKDLNPQTTASDSHLLAYRAYSLYQLQQQQKPQDAEKSRREAKAIVDALATRKDDDVALAWAKALDARFENPGANPRDQIQQYEAALVRDPGNAVIRFLMGEAYARLGETELARTAWVQVLRESPNWPTPRVELANLLAGTGRTQTAVEEALTAYQSSKSLGAATGLVVALATRLDVSTNPSDLATVLKLATEIQQKVPGEPQTFPIYVSLLARTGDRDKAAAAVRDALAKDRTAKDFPTIGTDAWLRVASVSHAQHLGLERPILDHVQKAYGSSPRVALAGAVLRAEDGHPADGLKSLAAAAAAATSDQAMWHVTLAQFREYIHDPKAHDAWVKVGDDFPGDLAVQSTIVDLPDTSSAWSDRPFIQRTIDRLRSLTGDQGYHWQLARCRWLLTSPNREHDSAEAVVTLSDIVRGSPGMAVPRLYLARAMENVHNPSAAIEQLRIAADMDPENAAIALDLVRLYQADGKFDDAKAYLDRAARAAADDTTRRRVALAYARQGNTDAAITALTRGASDVAKVAADAGPATAALLADLSRRKGDFDTAAKLYQHLATAKDVDASSLAAAADFFASHGHKDQANAALARLASLNLKPGEREAIVAEFTEKHGSRDTAADLFRQAVDANPTDPQLWLKLVGFQLRQDQFDQAASTCDAALAKVPGDKDLTDLRNKAIALRGLSGGGTDTAALIAELSKDPEANKAAIASLTTFTESRKAHDPLDRAVAKLRKVADQYPTFLPVQTQVVRMYLQLAGTTKDQQYFDAAVTVAARAMNNFPNDPEPANLAAVVYAAGGKWNEVLSVAQEWRRRTLENPLGPDLAAAKALLELGRRAEAIQALQPYMDEAKQDPDKYNMVIGTYAQALVADAREPEAAALLAPYLSRSDDWRIPALRLAALAHDPASTSKWIRQVAPTVPADSLKGQYEIANAWYLAGLRFQKVDAAFSKDAFAKARDVITPLARRPDATVGVLLMSAAVAEQTDDSGATAIAAYRRVLQLDPKQPLAQNNLAYLLLTKGKESDLDEARQLAEHAVASVPDAGYYDTLARVYEKTGKRDRAIATFQKVLDLEPNNVQAMVPTIRLLNADGQRDAARAMMARLENVLQSNPSLQTPDIDIRSLRQQL